jgi:hypothetical protein
MAPARRAAGWFWGPGLRLAAAAGWHELGLPLLGAALFIEGGTRLDSPWAPTLRISAGYAVSPMLAPATAAARFSLFVGRLDASLLRFELERFALLPNFAVEVGRLTGRGENEPPVVAFGPRSDPWIALGYGLALELSLTRALHAGILFELQQPLRRYRYGFSSSAGVVDVAEVPAVQLATSLNVGMRFW